MSKTPLLTLAATLAASALWLAAPAGAQTAPATAEAAQQDHARDIVLGQADAPVTFIEYGSFTCPHCANFSNQVFPQLQAEYIDTGKVKFIHREVYFDRYGLWAAMVARCGGDLRYYGFVKTIYATQREWAASDDPAAVAENLRRMGRTAGLTDDQVNACLADSDMAQALVTAYQERANADQIEGTPTFFINGKKHGNLPWSEMKKLIDAELG